MSRWKTDWSKQPFQRKYEFQCKQDRLHRDEIEEAKLNRREKATDSLKNEPSEVDEGQGIPKAH
jgi:hypothetical protein